MQGESRTEDGDEAILESEKDDVEGRNEMRLVLCSAALDKWTMALGWRHEYVSADTIDSRRKMMGNQSRRARHLEGNGNLSSVLEAKK